MIQLLPGNWGVRLSMLSVAIWWAIFSIPLFRRVPEPPSASQKLQPGETLLRVSFGRLRDTLREIRHYRELFKYLVAFLIYNDGIGIVISIAAIYAAELGFGLTESILAIMLVQFVGIPYSLIFGNLPSSSDKRQTMYVAFVLFNIVALPLVGMGGRYLLPQGLTGTPSPPFMDTATAVGEGVYQVAGDTLTQIGAWQLETVTASTRGADEDASYASTSTIGDRLDFAFNGQQVILTYSTGPDYGIWAVEIDGAPLLADDAPMTIDAYRPTIRYDETITLQATEEGDHLLSLVNMATRAPDSSGNVMSISQIEVKPPLRTSNLLAIIGILLGTQVIGLIFAFLLGPTFFAGIAERLDTRGSIIIALVAYTIIAIWGYFLNSVVEFWFLAWLVAVVQGGSQALSRSLYAAMSPTALSGEFFGLFSIMSKFASFLSPLVFAAAVAIFGSSRPGILSIVIFFIVGIILLAQVDVAEGKRFAKAKDAALMAS